MTATLKTPFKTIGIYGRVKNPGIADTLKALVHYLRQHEHAIVVESETAAGLDDNSLPTVSREELGKHCNLLIVVGGDGSLLHAAHAVVKNEVPVLGVNRGRLGFLTDIHPNHLKKSNRYWMAITFLKNVSC